MKLELHGAVLSEDLPAIYAFIARDNPDAAERGLAAVRLTFDLIAREPGCGIVYPARNPQLRDARMLPINRFPNYLVFYRVEADTVRVLYVVHGARHLPRLFRLEPRD